LDDYAALPLPVRKPLAFRATLDSFGG